MPRWILWFSGTVDWSGLIDWFFGHISRFLGWRIEWFSRLVCGFTSVLGLSRFVHRFRSVHRLPGLVHRLRSVDSLFGYIWRLGSLIWPAGWRDWWRIGDCGFVANFGLETAVALDVISHNLGATIRKCDTVLAIYALSITFLLMAVVIVRLRMVD
jgi:hypothetical protein